MPLRPDVPSTRSMFQGASGGGSSAGIFPEEYSGSFLWILPFKNSFKTLVYIREKIQLDNNDLQHTLTQISIKVCIPRLKCRLHHFMVQVLKPLDWETKQLICWNIGYIQTFVLSFPGEPVLNYPMSVFLSLFPGGWSLTWCLRLGMMKEKECSQLLTHLKTGMGFFK